MKKIKNIGNISINGEKIFLFALTVSLAASFIINTTFMSFIEIKHLNWINYLMIGLLLIKIYIFDSFSWIQYLIITCLAFLGFISWRKTNYSNLWILITFIIGAKNVNFDKIVKRYFNVNFTLLILTIIYSLIGIIKNLKFLRAHVQRFSLGIDYPTDLAAYAFFLILAYCYLHFRDLNYTHYVAFAFVSILTFLITNSRLDFILILLIIPIMWLARRVSYDNNKHSFNKYVVDHYWALSIILPYVYILMNFYYHANDHIFFKINRLLSGRLEYGNLALNKYGIILFGQRVGEHGWGGPKGLAMSKNAAFKYFFIDSSYIRLMVIYGIIVGLALCIIMLIISVKGTLSQNYVLPAIILLISISSIIDQHMIEITYNIFVLALLANVQDTFGGNDNGETVFS